MLKVISFGEMIVDLISDRETEDLQSALIFRKMPGGAPANVAVGVARLGGNSAFLGKLGSDSMGEFLLKTLENEGVDTIGCVRDGHSRTMLALVSLGPGGERSFEFYGQPGAHTALRFEEIPQSIFEENAIFHFGSLTLIHQQIRSTCTRMLEIAKSRDRLVSFDPNLRLILWEQESQARERVLEVLGFVDLLKVSREELEFLGDSDSFLQQVGSLMERGPKVVCVTHGEGGSELFYRGFHSRVAAMSVSPVDTTGAGDGFMAGLLRGISGWGSLEPLSTLSNRERLLRMANHVAALVTTETGAMTALPNQSKVAELAEFSLTSIQKIP